MIDLPKKKAIKLIALLLSLLLVWENVAQADPDLFDRNHLQPRTFFTAPGHVANIHLAAAMYFIKCMSKFEADPQNRNLSSIRRCARMAVDEMKRSKDIPPELLEKLHVLEEGSEEKDFAEDPSRGVPVIIDVGKCRIRYYNHRIPGSSVPSFPCDVKNNDEIGEYLSRQILTTELPEAGLIAKGDANELFKAFMEKEGGKGRKMRFSVESLMPMTAVVLRDRVNRSRLDAATKKITMNAINKLVMMKFVEFDPIVFRNEHDPTNARGWLLGFNTAILEQESGPSETPVTVDTLLGILIPNTMGLCSKALDLIDGDETILHEYVLHELLCPYFGHEKARKIQERLFPENYRDIVGERRDGHRDGELSIVLKQVIWEACEQEKTEDLDRAKLEEDFNEFKRQDFTGSGPQAATKYYSAYKKWYQWVRRFLTLKQSRLRKDDHSQVKNFIRAIDDKMNYIIAKVTWVWAMESIWNSVDDIIRGKKPAEFSPDEKERVRSAAEEIFKAHGEFMAQSPWADYVRGDGFIENSLRKIGELADTPLKEVQRVIEDTRKPIIDVVYEELVEKTAPAGPTDAKKETAVPAKGPQKEEKPSSSVKEKAPGLSLRQKLAMINWRSIFVTFAASLALSAVLYFILPVNRVTVIIAIVLPLVLFIYLLVRYWSWKNFFTAVGISLLLSFLLPVPWFGLSMAIVMMAQMARRGAPPARGAVIQAPKGAVTAGDKKAQAGTAESGEKPAQPVLPPMPEIKISKDIFELFVKIILEVQKRDEAKRTGEPSNEPITLDAHNLLNLVFHLEPLKEAPKVDKALKRTLEPLVIAELKRLEGGFSFDMLAAIEKLKNWKRTGEEALAEAFHELVQEVAQAVTSWSRGEDNRNEMMAIYEIVGEYYKIEKDKFDRVRLRLALNVIRDQVKSDGMIGNVDPEDYYLLGRLEFHFCNYDRSEKAFKSAIATAQPNADYLFSLGLLQHFLRKWKDAETPYTFSLRLREVETNPTELDILKRDLTKLLITKVQKHIPLEGTEDRSGDGRKRKPFDAATLDFLWKRIAPGMPLPEYAVKAAPWVEEVLFLALPLGVGHLVLGIGSIWTIALMAASRAAFFFLHDGARVHAPPSAYMTPLKVALTGFAISLVPVALSSAFTFSFFLFPFSLIAASTLVSVALHTRANLTALKAASSPAVIHGEEERRLPEEIVDAWHAVCGWESLWTKFFGDRERTLLQVVEQLKEEGYSVTLIPGDEDLASFAEGVRSRHILAMASQEYAMIEDGEGSRKGPHLDFIKTNGASDIKRLTQMPNDHAQGLGVQSELVTLVRDKQRKGGITIVAVKPGKGPYAEKVFVVNPGKQENVIEREIEALEYLPQERSTTSIKKAFIHAGFEAEDAETDIWQRVVREVRDVLGFDLLDIVGAGENGVVFKVRDAFGRVFALKVFAGLGEGGRYGKYHPVYGDRLEKQFRKELETLKKLNKGKRPESIPELCGYGELKEFDYYITDYFDGIDLDVLRRKGFILPVFGNLKRGGKVNREGLRLLAEAMLQMIEANQYMANCGIDHGNKPRNIMVGVYGENGKYTVKVKFVDFGDTVSAGEDKAPFTKMARSTGIGLWALVDNPELMGSTDESMVLGTYNQAIAGRIALITKDAVVNPEGAKMVLFDIMEEATRMEDAIPRPLDEMVPYEEAVPQVGIPEKQGSSVRIKATVKVPGPRGLLIAEEDTADAAIEELCRKTVSDPSARVLAEGDALWEHINSELRHRGLDAFPQGGRPELYVVKDGSVRYLFGFPAASGSVEFEDLLPVVSYMSARDKVLRVFVTEKFYGDYLEMSHMESSYMTETLGVRRLAELLDREREDYKLATAGTPAAERKRKVSARSAYFKGKNESVGPYHKWVIDNLALTESGRDHIMMILDEYRPASEDPVEREYEESFYEYAKRTLPRGKFSGDAQRAAHHIFHAYRYGDMVSFEKLCREAGIDWRVLDAKIISEENKHVRNMIVGFNPDVLITTTHETDVAMDTSKNIVRKTTKGPSAEFFRAVYGDPEARRSVGVLLNSYMETGNHDFLDGKNHSAEVSYLAEMFGKFCRETGLHEDIIKHYKGLTPGLVHEAFGEHIRIIANYFQAQKRLGGLIAAFAVIDGEIYQEKVTTVHKYLIDLMNGEGRFKGFKGTQEDKDAVARDILSKTLDCLVECARRGAVVDSSKLSNIGVRENGEVVLFDLGKVTFKDWRKGENVWGEFKRNLFRAHMMFSHHKIFHLEEKGSDDTETEYVLLDPEAAKESKRRWAAIWRELISGEPQQPVDQLQWKGVPKCNAIIARMDEALGREASAIKRNHRRITFMPNAITREEILRLIMEEAESAIRPALTERISVKEVVREIVRSDVSSMGDYARTALYRDAVEDPDYTLVTERFYHATDLEDLAGILKALEIEPRKSYADYGVFVSRAMRGSVMNWASSYSGRFMPEYPEKRAVAIEFIPTTKTEITARPVASPIGKQTTWWRFNSGIDLRPSAGMVKGRLRVIVEDSKDLAEAQAILDGSRENLRKNGIEAEAITQYDLETEIILQRKAFCRVADLHAAARIEGLKAKIKQGEKVNILFVCVANAQRSFIMQMVAGHLAAKKGLNNVTTSSCGQINLPSPHMGLAQVCKDKGVDPVMVDAFTTSRISAEKLNAADIVVVVDNFVSQAIKEDFPEFGEKVVLFSHVSPSQALRLQGHMSASDLVFDDYMPDFTQVEDKVTAEEYYDIIYKALDEGLFDLWADRTGAKVTAAVPEKPLPKTEPGRPGKESEGFVIDDPLPGDAVRINELAGYVGDDLALGPIAFRDYISLSPNSPQSGCYLKVCRFEGEVVGFILALGAPPSDKTRAPSAENALSIEQISVAETFQKRGIASTLLDHVMSRAREDGYNLFRIKARDKDMQRIVISRGFAPRPGAGYYVWKAPMPEEPKSSAAEKKDPRPKGGASGEIIKNAETVIPSLVNALIATSDRKERTVLALDTGLGEGEVNSILRDLVKILSQIDGNNEELKRFLKNLEIVKGDGEALARRIGNLTSLEHGGVKAENVVVITKSANVGLYSAIDGKGTVAGIDDNAFPETAYLPLLEVMLFAVGKHLGWDEKTLLRHYGLIPNVIAAEDLSPEDYGKIFGTGGKTIVIRLVPNAEKFKKEELRDLMDGLRTMLARA